MLETNITLFDQNIVEPAHEMGAFEALWANGISSFKQLHDKLHSSSSALPGAFINSKEAKIFYKKAVDALHASGIEHFGIRVDQTVDYPDKLHDADYPLSFLYYQGDWNLVYTPGIAVVGTRHPSEAGITRTRKLVKALVDAGYTIYSGLAAGIDTIAHTTAIECAGRTVAVLGTPLNVPYPKENAALQAHIAKEHLVISQAPIVAYSEKGIDITRFFFPERNKTMAALSDATIIIEAGETSGTLIQAKAALKQGRKVLILNNNFENTTLRWPQQLEKKGAIRIYNVQDMLSELMDEKKATDHFHIRRSHHTEDRLQAE